MKVIIAFNLARPKNEIHAQFHKSVRALILQVDVEKLSFIELYALYNIALNNELEALFIVTKSRKTEKISDKDLDRDNIFRGFSDIVKGYRNHFDADYRAAANVLWSLFQHFGNVAKKSLDGETAAIDEFIKEFENPEVEAAAEILRVNDWLNQLKAENVRFQQLMMERYCEKTDKTAFRMRTARMETDKFYHAIVENVNHQVLLGEITPKLQHFITELNGIVTRFKGILAQKQSKKKKAEDSV